MAGEIKVVQIHIFVGEPGIFPPNHRNRIDVHMWCVCVCMLLLCIALLAGPSPILIRIIYLCTIFPFPTENYHSLRPCETAAEQQQHQPPVGNAIERNKILDKVIDKMEIGSERDKCYMKTSIHTNNGFSIYFVQYVRGI